MGHSMGGYTCKALPGAWASWRRAEVVAAALSPWHRPYMVQNRVGDMTKDYALPGRHAGQPDRWGTLAAGRDLRTDLAVKVWPDLRPRRTHGLDRQRSLWPVP